MHEISCQKLASTRAAGKRRGTIRTFSDRDHNPQTVDSGKRAAPDPGKGQLSGATGRRMGIAKPNPTPPGTKSSSSFWLVNRHFLDCFCSLQGGGRRRGSVTTQAVIQPQSYSAPVFDGLLLRETGRALPALRHRRRLYSGWRSEGSAFAHWVAGTDQRRPVRTLPHAFASPVNAQSVLPPTSDATIPAAAHMLAAAQAISLSRCNYPRSIFGLLVISGACDISATLMCGFKHWPAAARCDGLTKGRVSAS